MTKANIHEDRKRFFICAPDRTWCEEWSVERIGFFPQSRRESRWRKAGSLRIGEHCGRNAVGRNRGGAMGIEWTSSLVLSHVAGECEVAGELARQESAGL